MATIADAATLLETIAPAGLAEEWDNVGLLVGDPAGPLRRVITCLTLTEDVVDETIRADADLVVTHHPLPFRATKRLVTSDDPGGRLWRLARAGVAVYSPHTAYDSAAGGINAQWAERLGLSDTVPLAPAPERADGAGVGRIGKWDGTGGVSGFSGLVEDVKRVANLDSIRVVPPKADRQLSVAIACGSGGSLVELAIAAGAGVLVTGELGFHECLRCRDAGVGVVLTGHYASERFAVEALADRLAEGLPNVAVHASEAESDPLRSA